MRRLSDDNLTKFIYSWLCVPSFKRYIILSNWIFFVLQKGDNLFAKLLTKFQTRVCPDCYCCWCKTFYANEALRRLLKIKDPLELRVSLAAAARVAKGTFKY